MSTHSESLFDYIVGRFLANEQQLGVGDHLTRPFGDFDSVQLRQTDIQPNQIGSQFFYLLNAFQSVGCLAHDPTPRLFPQKRTGELTKLLKIFDYEYLKGAQALPQILATGNSRVTSEGSLGWTNLEDRTQAVCSILTTFENLRSGLLKCQPFDKISPKSRVKGDAPQEIQRADELFLRLDRNKAHPRSLPRFGDCL